MNKTSSASSQNFHFSLGLFYWAAIASVYTWDRTPSGFTTEGTENPIALNTALS